jgi:hypothetical protein
MRTVASAASVTSSGVAMSDFTVAYSGGATSTNGAGNWSTYNSCLVSYTVASGLTTFRPGTLTLSNAASYLAFDSEL